MSADAERLASVNEGDTKSTNAALDSAEQSAIDRARNFQKAADKVMSKMANEIEHVTKEDADLLHSRDRRGFEYTSKGGVTSQAQSMAAENKQSGSI